MKCFQNQKQKQSALSTKTDRAVGEREGEKKNGHREPDEMERVFAETGGEKEEKKKNEKRERWRDL